MQWCLQIGGELRQGERQVRPQKRPDRYLLGDAMTAKTAPKPKYKKSKSNPAPAAGASMMSMATRSLINMVAVATVSGGVLLTLLAETTAFRAAFLRMRRVMEDARRVPATGVSNRDLRRPAAAASDQD